MNRTAVFTKVTHAMITIRHFSCDGVATLTAKMLFARGRKIKISCMCHVAILSVLRRVADKT